MSKLVRTVQRVVQAAPEEVFEVLARPARHKEFDGSGTVGAPVDGPERPGLGESFTMSMRMGVPYRTTSTVVEFEPGRVIAWQTAEVVKGHKIFGGQVWRYRLEPLDGGRTLVRQSYDLDEAVAKRLFARVAGLATEQAMMRSLDRLAAIFEPR